MSFNCCVTILTSRNKNVIMVVFVFIENVQMYISLSLVCATTYTVLEITAGHWPLSDQF